MKRFLTTGFLGAILGIVIGGAPADASLISRGFLDEVLTSYATTTALDLKANQSDFTDLSDKIGTLPEGITLENFYKGWVDSGGESMAEYIAKQQGVFYTYDPVDDVASPQRFPDVEYLDVLARLMDQEGFVRAENSVLAPFFYLTRQAMRVGEIPRGKTAAGMIDEINTKIGTLPSGSLLGNSPAMDVLFMYTQNTDTPVFPNSLSDLINQLYGSNGMGAITALLHGFDFDYFGEDVPVVGILPAMELGLSATQAAETALATATAAKTAADANTAKIGDLPSGLTVANLYNDWTDSDGYSVRGLRILEDKNFTAYNPRTGQLNETTDLFMGGLLGMLYQLFSSNGYEIADEVIAPFWYLTKQALSVGEIPHEKTVAGMIDEINTKIGTLPTEYATVGAALTAMDAKITAKNLPSTSDDGQYVLTAKKIGETISYTWVKMDLTNEEQSQ